MSDGPYLSQAEFDAIRKIMQEQNDAKPEYEAPRVTEIDPVEPAKLYRATGVRGDAGMVVIAERIVAWDYQGDSGVWFLFGDTEASASVVAVPLTKWDWVEITEMRS